MPRKTSRVVSQTVEHDNYFSEGGIKSKERSAKFGEVFTPSWVVKKMCDMIPEDGYGIGRTFLEPACGTGNFLVEIFRRKLEYCTDILDGISALNSIYGIDIQQDNVSQSRQRLRRMFTERFSVCPPAVDEILERNIVCGNFLHPETVWFLWENYKLIPEDAESEKLWRINHGCSPANEGTYFHYIFASTKTEVRKKLASCGMDAETGWKIWRIDEIADEERQKILAHPENFPVWSRFLS